MDALAIGSESPPVRQSILGSFLRGRPRGVSQSHQSPPAHDHLQPTRDSPPPSANQDALGHRRRPAAVQPTLSQSLQPSPSVSNTPAGAFTQMLRRRRSAGALAATNLPQAPVIAVARTAAPAPTSSSAPVGAPHRIRLVPHLDSRRSLRFDPISRDVREGEPPLRIGRFTDRSGLGLAAANALGSNKLAFKSKVVSRAHAEIWVETGGKFFIKDTKSSSGTFLNHVRLSPANSESRPSELKDGDLLQLGVDYQGGTEDIYKCVKIKIEVGREWQNQSNPFNTNALKQLKAIAAPLGATGAPEKKHGSSGKTSLPDCCICLFSVRLQQALFIAPCSHTFHYKCLRPLLELHHPAFSCPLCRTFANLEEDVEFDVEQDADSVVEAPLAIAVIASVAPVVPERSRERDPGAETEVELDTGAPRLGQSLRRRPLITDGGDHTMNLPEDVDEEMEESPLPPLPEDHSDDIDAEPEIHRRDMSVSPAPMGSRNSRSAEFIYEVDGEASGSGEIDAGVSDGSGIGDHSINGKRKRVNPLQGIL